MATGDLKNNLQKLRGELKAMKYSHDIDYESLGRGITTAFLPLYHYAFVEYSIPLAQKILDLHYEMYSKTDLRFIETMYKVLRELCKYKPPLTKEQFFGAGFAERKVMMCCDILHLVQQTHRTLSGNKPTAKNSKLVQSATGVAKKPTQLSSSATSTPDVHLLNEEVIRPIRSQSSKNAEVVKVLSLDEGPFRSSPLVPLVIKETSTARQPALDLQNTSHEMRSCAETETESRSAAGSRLESGEPVELQSKLDQDRLMLMEMSIGSQQSIISNICEKLDRLASEMESMESRLDRLNVALDSSQVCGNTGRHEDDSSCSRLERTMTNLVARLTLVENRVSILEQQSKPSVQMIFPSLENGNTSDRALPIVEPVQPETVTSLPPSSPLPTVMHSRAQSNTSESSTSIAHVAEPANTGTMSQGERIEAMLRVTDELLTKNVKQPLAASSGFLHSVDREMDMDATLVADGNYINH